MNGSDWTILTANVYPEQKARLQEYAEAHGMSRSEALRAIIDRATVHLRKDPRGGHTCPEGVFERYGTSNPELDPPCPTCWPVMPTSVEKDAAVREVEFQRRFHDVRVPYWVVIHTRRRAEDKA